MEKFDKVYQEVLNENSGRKYLLSGNEQGVQKELYDSIQKVLAILESQVYNNVTVVLKRHPLYTDTFEVEVKVGY